jgi:superfamily II helicase
MEMNSKDMNDNSDQITKKPRASNDSITENDNSNNDLSKNEEGNANTNLVCAICLESGTEDNKLISHQCSQCKKDAWKICDNCNQTRLSRLCPICNGDYAPLILHLVPGNFMK